MKKIIIAAALMGVFSATAYAQQSTKSGVYITGKVGVSIVDMSGLRLQYIDDLDASNNQTLPLNSKNKSVFGGGIAFGYNFAPQFGLPIRAELDVVARGKAKATQSWGVTANPFSASANIGNEIKLTTVMANGYYDFENDSAFTPYVSAGIGYAHLKHTVKVGASASNGQTSVSDSGSASHTSNNFAWSLGAGVQYALNDDLALDLSYKFIDAGKSKFSDRGEDESLHARTKVKSHDLMLGVTYSF